MTAICFRENDKMIVTNAWTMHENSDGSVDVTYQTDSGTNETSPRAAIKLRMSQKQFLQRLYRANLDPITANLVGMFLRDTAKKDDTTLLDGMKVYSKYTRMIRRRVNMMVALENTIIDGKTQFDRLLEMRPNDDDSWRDGGRPSNIAWALDDISDVISDVILIFRTFVPHKDKQSR